MLVELQIRNFLIIESLSLPFESGMTVITGETGAGKSILLDALQFVAGSRSDAKIIRAGVNAAEVNAQFGLSPHHAAHLLLAEWGIESEGGGCIVRRMVNADGRSKSYINGQLVSVTQLKSLVELLLNWVGQYEHQALLRADAQRNALDRFAQVDAVLQAVAESAHRLNQLNAEFRHMQEKAQKEQESNAFKNYRLELLEGLSLQETEWEALHQEQKKLAAGAGLLTKLGEMLNHLHEDEVSLIAQVKRLEKEASQLASAFIELKDPAQLSATAAANLEETYHELKAFYDSLELDPERLQEVEARLAEIHACSRKLQLQVEELFQYHQALRQELTEIESLDQDLTAVQKALEVEQGVYLEQAKKLTAMRKQAALKLAQHVSQEIKTLGMKEGQFEIAVTTHLNHFGAKGQDEVEFRVRMNPGQKWSSLKEGASGGELSRIALVIAVTNAQQDDAETLIFDEVDVGVSGAVAEKVGQLLKKLGTESQVLCITHLPQVALLGDQHIHVSKEVKTGQTFGFAKPLSFEERIEEVARIMSGENITEHARKLAREGLSG